MLVRNCYKQKLGKWTNNTADFLNHLAWTSFAKINEKYSDPKTGLPHVFCSYFSGIFPEKGATQHSFVRGCSALMSKPFPFCMPLLTKKLPMSNTFHGKWCPFHISPVKTAFPHLIMKKEREKKCFG